MADLAEVSAPAEHEMEEFEADSDTNAAHPGDQDSDDADDSDEEHRYAVQSMHLLCDCCPLSCRLRKLPQVPKGINCIV